MDSVKLKFDLKKMIIDECEKEDVTPEDIADDIEIFAPECILELDSVDALQISMALQKEYGIRLPDPKEFRRVVTTVDNLASYIIKNHG